MWLKASECLPRWLFLVWQLLRTCHISMLMANGITPLGRCAPALLRAGCILLVLWRPFKAVSCSLRCTAATITRLDRRMLVTLPCIHSHTPLALQGSGARIQADFGLPNLIQFPITEDLSVAGDSGTPLVVAEPTGPVARCFSDLGAAVVQEIAKLRAQRKNSVRFDTELGAFVVKLPEATGLGGEEFLLHPATVRRNDTSARSVNEWTGERTLRNEDVAEGVLPAEVSPLGNYAIQITWQDGFNQVAPFVLLAGLERLSVAECQQRAAVRALSDVPEVEFADL
jgi:hypothetical protein